MVSDSQALAEFNGMLSNFCSLPNRADRATAADVMSDFCEERGDVLRARLLRLTARGFRSAQRVGPVGWAGWKWGWDVGTDLARYSFEVIVGVNPVQACYVSVQRVRPEVCDRVWLIVNEGPGAGWVNAACTVNEFKTVHWPWMTDELTQFLDAVDRSKAAKSRPTPIGFCRVKVPAVSGYRTCAYRVVPYRRRRGV